MHQWKNEDAIKDFEKALELDSRNQKALTNIGCTYSNMQQFPKAFEFLNKSAKMDSTDFQPYYFMGITYQNMGEATKAKECFEKAKRLGGGQ